MNVRVLRELVISVAHKLSDDMVGRYDEVVTLKKVIEQQLQVIENSMRDCRILCGRFEL